MYGINLLFDAETSAKIERLWDISANFGSRLRKENTTPHLTLAIFDEISLKVLEQRLFRVSKENVSFNLYIPAVGCFPSTDDVILLFPAVNSDLLSLYLHVFDLFKDFHNLSNNSSTHDRFSSTSNLHKYFYPDKWIPHITIASRLQDSQFSTAFSHLKKRFRPLTGTIESISFLDFEGGKSEENHIKFSLQK